MSNQNEIIEKVNKIVIEGLSREGLSWFKPWKQGTDNAPFNLHTKRYYSGFNIFLLNCIMKAEGYEFNQWLTFKQVSEKGGKVKKGSKSTDVYFWSVGYYDHKTGKYVPAKDVKNINPAEKLPTGKDRYQKTFTVKFYKVFNVGQTEGIQHINTGSTVQEIANKPIEVADEIVLNYVGNQKGFQITHGLGGAYYIPSKDIVNMPKLEDFTDSDSYYKTLFHELAHSTGHSQRLNRKTMLEASKWGKKSYAKEELVAEISSMYMVGLLGLNPKDSDTNSQSYINGWVKHLTNHPKECMTAMQQATKAVDFITLKAA